ncbi:hypothetical protein PHET_11422 [Paragonimus heterotremus]|uniref:Uncharacterized protein n=1 Tax=Paragonimus heterotremus TaxID=100268 RepID=A0A8J4WDP8_9TREM|nr:hypothetical protein PHET_11422 [Paragonimus heterotremus]
MVAKAHIDQLLDGPRLNDNDSAALVQLVQQMTVCEVTLRQLNYDSDLNSCRTIETIVRRLPSELRFKLADEAAIITRSSREPQFADLTRFVEERADNASLRYGIDALQDNLERLYQQDFIDAGTIKVNKMFVGDHQAIGLVETSLRLSDGHHEVARPWRPGFFLSPDNRSVAQGRLYVLRQRLMKGGELAQHYSHVMGGYISRGHAELVFEDGPANCPWYLPHHPVLHPADPQKLRIFFDCAAKYADKSLNNRLLSGSYPTSSLVSVLLRFRQGKTAVMVDIEAMFHQVRVPDKNCDALTFLWWTNAGMQGSPTE